MKQRYMARLNCRPFSSPLSSGALYVVESADLHPSRHALPQEKLATGPWTGRRTPEQSLWGLLTLVPLAHHVTLGCGCNDMPRPSSSSSGLSPCLTSSPLLSSPIDLPATVHTPSSCPCPPRRATRAAQSFSGSVVHSDSLRIRIRIHARSPLLVSDLESPVFAGRPMQSHAPCCKSCSHPRASCTSTHIHFPQPTGLDPSRDQ